MFNPIGCKVRFALDFPVFLKCKEKPIFRKRKIAGERYQGRSALKGNLLGQNSLQLCSIKVQDKWQPFVFSPPKESS